MDAVEDIKGRLSIEDVVSEYVQLKRAGRNFKGLSPFTNERTPSFIVSPEKQIWHDFSSGRGGDMFTFIQEVEGVDFKRSLEILAQKSGLDLAEYRSKFSGDGSGGQKDFKERLYQAAEWAAVYYQRKLLGSGGQNALNYVRKARGYDKQTILDFRFGYSPEKGSPLMEALMEKGFSQKELRSAGLLGERDGRYFDMFRGRLMVPLLDPQGRPVGFTARILNKDPDAPKYINTPATILYDKGRQLFGFSQAKNAIRKSGFVVVVEGNLDVVASHQAGVQNVVASAGTALTEYQLKELQRFTGDIRLAFDCDRAGQAAAERIVPIAQKLGLEMSVISIPEGKDPDDLIRDDPKMWTKAIESNRYMLDWLIDRFAQVNDVKTANGKRALTDEMFKILSKVDDPVEREHYLNQLSEMTKTSLASLNKKFALFSNSPDGNPRLKKVKVSDVNGGDQALSSSRELQAILQNLFALAISNQLAKEFLKSLPDNIFDDQEAREYYKSINQGSDNYEKSNNSTNYAKMVALLNEEMYQSSDSEEQDYQARNLAKRLAEQYAKTKTNLIQEKLQNADPKSEKQLLEQVKEIDQLRREMIDNINAF